jgi:hypothetical protein
MSLAIINQAKLAGIALAAGLAFSAFGTGAALAVSPSEQQCTTAGGTFDRTGGQVSCTFTTTTNVGNSDNSQTTTTTDTDGSNGTLNNDPQQTTSSSCSGPGASTGSAHCN